MMDRALAHFIWICLLLITAWALVGPLLLPGDPRAEAMAMLDDSLAREQRMRDIIVDRDRAIEVKDELLEAVFRDGGTLRIVNFNPCLDCHAGCM